MKLIYHRYKHFWGWCLNAVVAQQLFDRGNSLHGRIWYTEAMSQTHMNPDGNLRNNV